MKKKFCNRKILHLIMSPTIYISYCLDVRLILYIFLKFKRNVESVPVLLCVFGSEYVMFGSYDAYSFIFIQMHLFTKRCVGLVVFCKGLEREVFGLNPGLSIWSLYILPCFFFLKKKKGGKGLTEIQSLNLQCGTCT